MVRTFHVKTEGPERGALTTDRSQMGDTSQYAVRTVKIRPTAEIPWGYAPLRDPS
ncbi:MAG: hypothetical protein KTR25_13985 [Myxococcales bacterium]|nr:hypothetical protein [Myxococcales bacterium]